MKAYILAIRSFPWKQPTKRLVFDSIETAVASAEGLAADLKRAPEGDDWRERLARFETVRFEGLMTMTIEESLFETAPVESASELPEPTQPYDQNPDYLVCYVLMRRDVPDFVNGKAMAQSNHAGTKMMWDAFKKKDRALRKDILEWLEVADGFGTCLTMEASAADMRQAVSLAQLLGFHAGFVDDPTYPIRDGYEIKTLPVTTCAYVFGWKSKLVPVMGRFDLFKDK